jgi:glycosyltransferase involved in cell wall biosynthesis
VELTSDKGDGTTAYLIEPAKDINGHHISAMMALQTAALEHGHKVVWIGHKDTDEAYVLPAVKFVPAFSSTLYQNQIGFLGRCLRALLGDRHFIRKIFSESRLEIALRHRFGFKFLRGDRAIEFCDAMFKENPRSEDNVIVHSAEPQALDMVAEWLLHYPSRAHPRIYIRTCWSDANMPFGDYAGGFAATARRLASIAREVRFACETPALAEMYSRSTGLRFSYCPPFVDPMAFGSRNVGVGDCVTVGWLGDPRKEKGAMILPEIIRRTLSLRQNGKIKFLLQCAGKNKRWLNDLNKQLDEFGEAVERIPSGASRNAYWDAFHRADIILLPYDPCSYPKERGSNIAVEALLTGKPMITAKNIFAAEMITPDTGISVSGAKEMTDAILKMANNIAKYRTLATQNREKILQHYNPLSVYKQLISADVG